MDKLFESHPIVDHFANGEVREKKWIDYKIVDETVYPTNPVNGSTANSQILRFHIPARGLLNKLALKHLVTFNDDSATFDSNSINWTGLQLLETAKLFCGGRLMYELRPEDILAHIENSSDSDVEIYNEVIPKTKTNYSTATDGDQYTYYTPLTFDCFNSPDNLLDTQFLGDLMLELVLKSPQDVLENDSDDFTYDQCTLLSQFIEVKDYDKYFKDRFTDSYPYLTTEYFHEPRYTYAGTSGASYTTPFVEIGCDKMALETVIAVFSTSEGMYLDAMDITKVRIKRDDRVIYDSTTNENLLMHHTEYRHHAHTKNNVRPATTLLHIVPWGVRSSTDISNYLDFAEEDDHGGRMKYFVEVTFTATATANYELAIFHECYKQYVFDRKGSISKTFY